MFLRYSTMAAFILVAASGCASAVDYDDTDESIGTAESPVTGFSRDSNLEAAPIIGSPGGTLCNSLATTWLADAKAATTVLDNNCKNDWSSFGDVRRTLNIRYDSLTSKCASYLSWYTNIALASAHDKVGTAGDLCADAARCHDAADTYDEVAWRLQMIVDNGCSDPDYWPLEWNTNALYSEAMTACYWDHPEFYSQVSSQMSKAVLCVSHAAECSKPQYAETRCHLDKVSWVKVKKQVGSYSKEFNAESRLYLCPSATDIALCEAIHPTTVSVDKSYYVISASKDVEIIVNTCEIGS